MGNSQTNVLAAKDFEQIVPPDWIAQRMGVPGPMSVYRDALETIGLYLIGFGSIARPASERLVGFGAKNLVLVDPKRYRPESVASQCEPTDVGRHKVHVGAELLGRQGAEILALPDDVSTCPDGLVPEGGVVMVSADNRRADIVANRLAARMQARLVKVNIEPRYGFVSARYYDFRRDVQVCCECQFSDAAYRNQRHPKSCDRPVGRHTASPRWLSNVAGTVAALAVVQMVDDGLAQAVCDRQWHLSTLDGSSGWSELTPSAECRWVHDRHWPNLTRLAEGPGDVTLAGLLKRAAVAWSTADLRFCQQVATRLSCDRCGQLVSRVAWVCEVDRPVGCCDCGGQLLPVPYWTYRQLKARQLASVALLPLAAWNVGAGAVLEMGDSTRRQAFVVGGLPDLVNQNSSQGEAS